MNLEVGDIVSCTVDRIVGTVVFVKIHNIVGAGKDIEGSIILSEIAPGRIRNLRDYVVPKKKIVCKVLRISGDRIDLSLRRVTQKEKKEILEKEKTEKSYTSILKSILGEKTKEIINEVQKEESLYDFLEEVKQNSKKLEKIIGKNDSKKILEILKTQKQKKAIIKKEILLTTTKPNGLTLIKNLLTSKKVKEAEIKYISAGKYSVKTEADNIKQADNKFKEIASEIEKDAKQQGIDFSVKEK